MIGALHVSESSRHERSRRCAASQHLAVDVALGRAGRQVLNVIAPGAVVGCICRLRSTALRTRRLAESVVPRIAGDAATGCGWATHESTHFFGEYVTDTV